MMNDINNQVSRLIDYSSVLVDYAMNYYHQLMSTFVRTVIDSIRQVIKKMESRTPTAYLDHFYQNENSSYIPCLYIILFHHVLIVIVDSKKIEILIFYSHMIRDLMMTHILRLYRKRRLILSH